MFLFERAAPRWLILIADLVIAACSLVLAYLLRFNFATIPQAEVDTFPLVFSVALTAYAISFLLSRTYQGMIRYTGSKDAQRIFVANTFTTLSFILINRILFHFITGSYLFPFSVIIIQYLTVTFLMISLRLVFKAAYMEWRNPSDSKTNVIIYGAGESGLITKRTLDRDAGMKYNVTAFLDDEKTKWGKKLEGITIYGKEKLESLLKERHVKHLIISIQNLHPGNKENLVDTCLRYNTKILNVPPVSSWINGELSFMQIKKVKIEDLLERDVIQLDQDIIQKQIFDNTVLVSGAAGSIGCEIVRQISRFNPSKIILLDIAESPLYEMELELKNVLYLHACEIVVADIRNKERIEHIFEKYRPQVVYHAAAYKHVPMMEHHPLEAIHTNVIGTRIIADAAVKYGVEKFVMVSTDKAVNPTNVMGASKRIAEMYVQSMNKGSRTKFITTRFGNVLDSNGSVIKLFRHQIEKGGPVTVTHPDITRYFMTIPEACQLVLEAGAMGNGGEIFVFNMGHSVKIDDLAKKMIRLAGLTLGKDIQIIYSGLRPGEKLFEELLATKENTMPTYHSQILLGKVREVEYGWVAEQIIELEEMLHQQDSIAVVRKMKEIVPEFKSRNSAFEELDKSAAA